MKAHFNVRCPHCQTLCRVNADFETFTERAVATVECHRDANVTEVEYGDGRVVLPDGCGAIFVVRAHLTTKIDGVYMEVS